jgi:hypothetical protein
MPNLKSLKALRKVMQDAGLLRQVEEMAAVPKRGIMSSEAIEAAQQGKNALDNPYTRDEAVRSLRDARKDTIRNDYLADLEDKRMIESDLNERINRAGAVDEDIRAFEKIRSLLEKKEQPKLPSGTRNVEMSERDKLVSDVVSAKMNPRGGKAPDAEKALRDHDYWNFQDLVRGRKRSE